MNSAAIHFINFMPAFLYVCYIIFLKCTVEDVEFNKILTVNVASEYLMFWHPHSLMQVAFNVRRKYTQAVVNDKLVNLLF